MSLHHLPRFRTSYFVVTILLSTALSATLANPVSSPEIGNNKSGKSLTSAIVNNANSLQQQQQQKSNPQDTHLNSLTVFATNFDSITSGNPQQPSGNFKPSYSYNSDSNSNSNYNGISHSNNNNHNQNNDNYNSNSNRPNNNNNNNNNQNYNNYLQIPEMETNFTPMQQSTSLQPNDLSQPVLMQYLPQTVQAPDGIQYLQLIPTRPLMVPISSYIPGTSAGQVTADVSTTISNNIGYRPQPATLSASNSIADYASRASPLLSQPLPANVAPPAPSVLMDIPTTHTYSLPSYAPQILHPYRNFRINRETKLKHLPPGMSLNLHEYMPSPHDPPRQAFARGRP